MSADLRAKNNAIAHLRTIKEIITALNEVEELEAHIDTTKFETEGVTVLYDGEDCSREDILDIIHTMPLSIMIRNDWHTPFENTNKPEEFTILLSTGGPACQIYGELNEYFYPCNVKIQYQDWFTPWIDLETSEEDDDILEQFCQQFYFGE